MGGLLPHLDHERILARYRASPGDEVGSGKFLSPRSSAALAANTFGFFLDRAREFPDIPEFGLTSPAISVCIERSLRFPWRGGRHPWLDAVIETDHELVAIESKRYEPFRAKARGSFSDAFWRHDWGIGLRRHEALRDALRDRAIEPRHLDAVQLVKHSFGAHTHARKAGKRAVVVYLHAEPSRWPAPDDRPIDPGAIAAHRGEIDAFARAVEGDHVRFVAMTYADLLAAFATGGVATRKHGEAVKSAFFGG